MSESGPNEGYRISRTLEAIDREIRRQNRRHAEEEEIPPFELGTNRIDQRGGARSGGERSVPRRLIKNAPISTHARLLLSDGVSLPCPEMLGDGEEVQLKLWEIINGLAARRVYLHHTNHLTNRELYAAMWTIHLNEVTRDLSGCPGAAWHIDLLSSGATRAGKRSLEKISDRRGPSYDRDRYLPRPG